MINKSINSKDALKIAFKNAYKRWVPAVAKEVGDPCNAMSRYGDDYFYVKPNPSFKIAKSSKVFTIGSCFARNVERALISKGVPLIGSDFALDGDVLHASVGAMNNKVNARSALNKYSTLSIVEEFERVLLDKKVPNEGFIEVEEGKWVDPQLASVLKPLSFEKLFSIRKEVNSLLHAILDADVVFVTLGLNEVWFDNETMCYLNSSPPPALMRSANERFTFSTPQFSEVYSALERFVNLITDMSSKSVKFIITVSPVPLSTTWTSSDVVIANTKSKATLRVCAEQISENFDHLDYFPSFEMVTNSPRKNAWSEDQLHVDNKMVEFVINNFIETYFD